MREYMRGYRKRNPLTEEQRRERSEYSTRWARENRERHAANTARTRARDPEKVWARNELNKAIARGEIERWPCERCGTTERVHGHHDDHSKPFEVRWLCSIHHGEVHREMRAAE